MPSIEIINVSTNQEKLTKLCQTIQKHFNLKERVLISVSNLEAAKYIDLLLWRSPQESFLPHQISELNCNSPVVITTTDQNLNQAKVLLNLSPTVHPHFKDYSIIYEILDETDQTKKELSLKKIAFYQQFGMM